MQLRRKLGSADEIIIPRVDYFFKSKVQNIICGRHFGECISKNKGKIK